MYVNVIIFLLVQIFSDEVLSVHYNFQEMHFQKAASEWFRFSKLRLSREQKNRHEADAGDDKEN